MKKLLLLLCFIIPALSFAQSTGFMSPSAVVAPSGGWSNPQNAFTSDDVYTDVPHQSGCRCPFLYLSWDNGVTYTSPQLVGPFGTADMTMTAGSPSDLWGHAWVDTEFTNSNFRFKIANPSTLIEQGYADFNFNIPSGSIITGIEVLVEQHGDSAYQTEFIDLIQVNVHFMNSTNTTNISFGSDISVYPNPANDVITISNLSSSTREIQITDLSGKVVMQSFPRSSDLVTFSIGELARGLYLIVLYDAEAGVLTRRIVVE